MYWLCQCKKTVTYCIHFMHFYKIERNHFPVNVLFDPKTFLCKGIWLSNILEELLLLQDKLCQLNYLWLGHLVSRLY